MPEQVFISSTQEELAAERRAVAEFIRRDPLLSGFFTVFLFEELSATDKRPDDLYLDEVDRSSVYIGIFGRRYGSQDSAGISPTEREFDRATALGKPRFVFLLGGDDGREAKLRALIDRASAGLVWRRAHDIPELTAEVNRSLVGYLKRTSRIRAGRFDEAACEPAGLGDISVEKVAWFLKTARKERQYPLAETTQPVEVLAHLNLLDAGLPTNAAVLLFAGEPQRFLLASEVKCLHFHGTEVRKPIPAYQIYKGTVFDLVDQAVDFILSKIARPVGIREQGPQAPVGYELPREAVAEAIVNAVVHRDYTSSASVQVMLFADRLEVWNPGALPPQLTPELLRLPHASIPHNPLLCEPMFLAHYAEKAGTGILDMIARCREAGLPEPDFRQDGGQFVQTLRRAWLTPAAIARLGLNARQAKAMAAARLERRLTNRRYQELTGTSRATAKRDLEDLLMKGLLRLVGSGRGAHYQTVENPPTDRQGPGGNGSANGS
jgi:predicted HTH transcriptional regulator